VEAARKCCAECFGDRELRQNISASKSKERGRCDYCGTADVDVIPPIELQTYFEVLLSIYELNKDGKFLVEWLREDWEMFHPAMDMARQKELLGDVLDDGEVVRQRFMPSARFVSDGLDRWEKLRTELMQENRYFPDAQLNTDTLREHLEQLKAEKPFETWYRARLQNSDTPFKVEEMGAPPQRSASHGRANPAGIPYLYLASDPETAVSETRPHTGDKACVAEFAIEAGLRLLDLRHPRRTVSPFGLADEDKMGQLRSDIAFLERLGEELTRPIVPQGAMIDYVPSQYLCEFIKKCGFAGVIYRSSVSEGINLALFKPALAKPRSVSPYVILKVSVDVRPA
jgi:hypothetical protein